MPDLFHRGQTPAPYLILANQLYGTKKEITGSALKIENEIKKRITSVHIVKNLYGDLWDDDIKQDITTERATTLIRFYTVRTIAEKLKYEPLFFENFTDEFEQLDEPRQLKSIMNYKKFLKYGQWCTRQFGENDQELRERWFDLDKFILSKEQAIRKRIDDALCNLENDIFEFNRVTDDEKCPRVIVLNTSTKCECGGRYTDHNLYKHLRTNRHLKYENCKFVDNEKDRILCECGQTINRFQFIRHSATILHYDKLRLIKQQKEKEQKATQ